MTKEQIEKVEEALVSIIVDTEQTVENRLNAAHALSAFENSDGSHIDDEEPEDWDWLRDQKLLDE